MIDHTVFPGPYLSPWTERATKPTAMMDIGQDTEMTLSDTMSRIALNGNTTSKEVTINPRIAVAALSVEAASTGIELDFASTSPNLETIRVA
jgi:hypothetical protein